MNLNSKFHPLTFINIKITWGIKKWITPVGRRGVQESVKSVDNKIS